MEVSITKFYKSYGCKKGILKYKREAKFMEIFHMYSIHVLV
jgi:hypothetical protein